MITAHIIRFSKGVSPPRPLIGMQTGGFPAGFYPARRAHRLAENKRMPAAGIKYHTVNHLRLVNNIQLRIFLHPPAVRRHAAFWNDGRQTVSRFAGELIDRQLRDEMDQQLALMRRGENIGQNQRRRSMLGTYLLAQPYRVIRGFCGVQMRALASENGAGPSGKDGFQQEIIREVRTHHTHTVHEQKRERIQVEPSGSDRVSAESARRIADQVLERVERKLRLDRERSGIFR